MKSSRKRRSSTWSWATAGRAWESRKRPLPPTSGRYKSNPIRRGRCALWRRSIRRTPNRFSRDAVQIAPNDPESWFRYGVLTASAERIQKAITLDPWLPDQSRRLAEVTHAEPALKDALRTDPFDDAAWDLGGRIMAEKGKFRDAFFDFERAIKLYPSGQYLYDYALALVRADRFDDAQKQTRNGRARGRRAGGGA